MAEAIPPNSLLANTVFLYRRVNFKKWINNLKKQQSGSIWTETPNLYGKCGIWCPNLPRHQYLKADTKPKSRYIIMCSLDEQNMDEHRSWSREFSMSCARYGNINGIMNRKNRPQGMSLCGWQPWLTLQYPVPICAYRSGMLNTSGGPQDSYVSQS